jgi:hypothetical protein
MLPGEIIADRWRGGLRIGCAPGVALQRLKSLVGALYAFDPDLRTEVLHLRGAAQLDRLEAGELEFGLVHGGERDGKIAFEPLFRGDPLVVILPVGHRLAGRTAVGVEDLRGEALVTFPRESDPALQDALMALIDSSGIDFCAVRECGDADPRDVLMAVAAGSGVTLAPAALRDYDGELGRALAWAELTPRLVMPDLLLAWRADPPPAVGRVLDAARAAARELYGAG